MAFEDRLLRERAVRRALIVTTARELAKKEGWDAVTTRRLSTEIEYSQPVLYRHFASMQDLVDAVALEAFQELAALLADARNQTTKPSDALRNLAHSYCRYAIDNAALYDAMFTRASRLPFGTGSSPAPMLDAFGQIRDAVAIAVGEEDVDTLTEVLWAALHGLNALGRSGRLRPDFENDRINLLVEQFLAAHSKRPAQDASA